MALEGERGSIRNDSLDPCFPRVVGFCPFLATQNAIAIMMINAKQKYTIIGTIPQNKVPWSMVFVGVLIAIVELYDSAVTNIPDLLSLLVPKSSSFREKLWLEDRPSICISGIVLKIHETFSWKLKTLVWKIYLFIYQHFKNRQLS